MEQLESISLITLLIQPFLLQLQLALPSQREVLVIIKVASEGFVINILQLGVLSQNSCPHALIYVLLLKFLRPYLLFYEARPLLGD